MTATATVYQKVYEGIVPEYKKVLTVFGLLVDEAAFRVDFLCNDLAAITGEFYTFDIDYNF